MSEHVYSPSLTSLSLSFPPSLLPSIPPSLPPSLLFLPAAPGVEGTSFFFCLLLSLFRLRCRSRCRAEEDEEEEGVVAGWREGGRGGRGGREGGRVSKAREE